MVKITVQLNEEEACFLEQYARVYEEERDIDFAADPIIAVQTKNFAPCDSSFTDKYIYLYGDEKDEIEYVEDLRDALEYEDIYSASKIEQIIEEVEDEGVYKDTFIEIFKQAVEIIYTPVAFFLTLAEARNYIRYQNHNLNKPRTFTYYCGYRNRGDLQSLMKLLRRMGIQLLD